MNNKIKVVYLKDGSIIKGEIIEDTGLGVKIKTECRNIWAFNRNDIDSIAIENVNSKDSFFETHSYFFITEVGTLSGSNNNERSHPFSLQMANNYLLKNNFSIGIGVGLEFYEEKVCPIFIDSRFIFNQTSIFFPLIYAKVGYTLSLEDKQNESDDQFNSKGGPMAGVGIGYVFALNDKNGIAISLGYRFQQLEHKRTNAWMPGEFYRYEKFNRVAIKVGLYID